MNTSTSAAQATAPTAFSALPLSPEMLANLQQLGYAQMTPIQAASLPLTLQGKDLIAQASTGSGKTAFGLPMVDRLNPRWFAVQALVLCPTRELADQVATEIRRLARAQDNIKVVTVYGGVPSRNQIASLENGAHIVVGTPGRVMDLMERGKLDIGNLKTLVLDEADRMLDMGFLGDIETVVRQCPADRQTLLFSATYPEGIASWPAASCATRRPSRSPPSTAPTRSPALVRGGANDKVYTVPKLLAHFRPESSIAFCNTKQQCRDVVAELQAQGFSAGAVRRAGAARARRGAGAVCQQELQRAGRHRRGGARPGHCRSVAVINVDVTPRCTSTASAAPAGAMPKAWR
jgi:ATP-independent RNA helicase DbpA